MSSIRKASITKSGTSSQKKPMEINMSCLSTAQKRMCIKLLAESSINFEQGKDCFQAQLKIDPHKLTSQFNIQKSELDFSAIEAKTDKKQQKILSNKKKSTFRNKENQKPQNAQLSQMNQKKRVKRDLEKLYNSNKKPLSKVIKNNPFKQLQQLHPTVQLYIYPKKLTFQSLTELIQTFYDKYWEDVVQKRNKIQKNTQRKNTLQNNKSQNGNSNLSFAKWIYDNYIMNQKDKMKLEQALVNLIQTLNHYSYKHPGVQLFSNFLEASYSLRALEYFLVIRSLLQQLYGQKILDRISNYSKKQGYTMRIKMNPFQKLIEEDKIFQFLEVCVVQQNNEELQKAQRQQYFQEMTGYMFFEQRKKKNYIQFYDMACVLLESFAKKQHHITGGDSLAYQTEPNALQNYICKSKQLAQELSLEDDSLDLCFEVKQKGSQTIQLSKYQSNLTLQKKQNSLQNSNFLRKLQQSQVSSYEQKFRKKVYEKFTELCAEFIPNAQDQTVENCSLLLQMILQAIVNGEKQAWLTYLQESEHFDKNDEQFEEKELLFVQKLQQEYRRFKQLKIVHMDFVRKILTTHALRQQMIKFLLC